jgi:hypothetical protein
MAEGWGEAYDRINLLRRVGDMRQIAGARPFEWVDGSERGTRGIRLYNAAGLDLDVITDRGMSIGRLTSGGVPLAYTSAVGASHPAFSEPYGKGWLNTWPAGFLTTCGLTQVGSPGRDGEAELGLHGRAAGLPAREVSYGGEWAGDDYRVWVQGTVVETAVFGDHLALTRKIWISLAEPVLHIEDSVENRGFSPAPHMFLQHMNLGYPLVQAGSRLHLPTHTTQPRDEDARLGLDRYDEFTEPQAGYREQVFYHDLAPDAQGQVSVALKSPSGLGVHLTYDRSQYPVLAEWKMMGEGLYVVGLEPANCHVGGRLQERESGTLQILAPQEIRRYILKIGFELR